MSLRGLVYSNRSVRRFIESEEIPIEVLEELIDLARNSPSARNDQPLKYSISSFKDMNSKIFPYLKWAGYLKDWDGPEIGERPSAYILILGDTRISETLECDVGIAMQSILLGAVEKGIHGCIIGSINRPSLREEIGIPDHLKILYVIALGKPAEKVYIENVKEDGDIKYWRDEEGNHHVPKRSIDDIIVNFD